MKYYITNSKKLTKFFRRKNDCMHDTVLVHVIEHLSFGKVKANLFYDDKHFPYCWANYLGTTIIESKDIYEVSESLYPLSKFYY